MRNKIEASASQQAELAKTFGTSTRNVRYALNFDTNSELAIRIRQGALRMGCKLYEIREVETPSRPVKVLDSKGNVTRVINE